MSSAATITWEEEDEPVSATDWADFATANGLTYSPRTVGGNYFYVGEGDRELEVSFGEGNGTSIPTEARQICVSTYFDGDITGVAKLAGAIWKRWGGCLDAALEVRAVFIGQLVS
ncbi:MAG: hypothetical protein ABR532_08945 [Candidatus Dormibacteria bacterium]